LDPRITGVARPPSCTGSATDAAAGTTALQARGRLLRYGEPYAGPADGALIVVTPRLGTVSPWASQGHRHRAQLRPGGAAGRARHRVPPDAEERPARRHQAADGERIAPPLAALLHDRMTESVACRRARPRRTCSTPSQAGRWRTSTCSAQGRAALEAANTRLRPGAVRRRDRLPGSGVHRRWSRNPTDVELMMFAQANSEHCRHKIFSNT
jgi:phosphoribosylformylglycinamidine synthase